MLTWYVYSAMGSCSMFPGIDVVLRSKRKHTTELTCFYKPEISWKAWSAPDHAHQKTGRNYNFLETQLQFFPGLLFDGKFLPEKWKTVGLSRSLSGTHKRLVKDWRRLGRIPQSFEHFCQVQTEATTGKLNHASAGSGVPQSTRVNSRLLKPSRALSGGHAKRAGKSRSIGPGSPRHQALVRYRRHCPQPSH